MVDCTKRSSQLTTLPTGQTVVAGVKTTPGKRRGGRSTTEKLEVIAICGIREVEVTTVIEIRCIQAGRLLSTQKQGVQQKNRIRQVDLSVGIGITPNELRLEPRLEHVLNPVVVREDQVQSSVLFYLDQFVAVDS